MGKFLFVCDRNPHLQKPHFKKVEKKIVPILVASFRDIKFVFCVIIRFNIFIKILCKSLFPFKQIMPPFKLQSFHEKTTFI